MAGLFNIFRNKKGRDKRGKIDPRYRDPNFPDYVDRRKGPSFYIHPKHEHTSKISLWFADHPETKTIVVIGLVTVAVVVLLFIGGALYMDHGPAIQEKGRRMLSPILGL